MRIMIAAGGTGGHIIPALAIADELYRRGDWQISWLGTKGMAELLSDKRFNFFPLSIVALRGKGWLRKLCYPFILAFAMLQSLILLLRLRPQALVVTGGYVSFPVAVVAKLLGKPIFIQEQNICWGMATKLLSKLAAKLYLGFPLQAQRTKAIHYGNPTLLEHSLADKNYPSPASRYKQRQGPIRLFVTGGSQGALVFNHIVPQSLAQLPPDRFIVHHQCGADWGEDTRNYYRSVASKVTIDEFITDMKKLYLWADLVIARAGALTLAELSLIGVASWLVPFPFATDDHQLKNASFFTERGAAQLIHQKDFTVDHLVNKLSSLGNYQQGRQSLARMAEQAHLLAHPHACRNIVDDIINQLGYGPG